VVVCGLINDFSRIDGVFNAFLSNFGLKPVNLLAEAGLFRIIFVGSSIWQTIGWSSIIYIATLSTVDPNLYDAAKIDGAGRLGRIIHISLPSLIPIVTVQFIMRIGNILSVGFEKIILLYNPLTYSTADVISTYIYRFGLEQANYSFGTAVGIFNSIVNIGVLIGVNSLFRRFSEESLW
jgi:putative aldouronate transport system permease protein